MLAGSFWRGRRVLLTGHTGFKGSWLTLWLLRLGAEVWGYSLPPEPGDGLFTALDLSSHVPLGNGGQLRQRFGDVLDLETLREQVVEAQPTIVLHLAAQPLVRRSYQDPLSTWATNVLGSMHVMEALRPLRQPCAVVMVTTDKVYENREWVHGYREPDPLGGHDPYSASKAAAELAIASWRASFCGTAAHQTPQPRIATARAGNVIGGGDWAAERIVPDAMRALAAGQPIPLRHPDATRPWQHVLDPLGGYLRLAEALARDPDPPCEAFNFGPPLASNRPVRELVDTILRHWPGEWVDQSEPGAPHEAGLLHLQIDKARHRLGWQPRWDFATTVARTVGWYRSLHEGGSAMACCLADLEAFEETGDHAS
ncbi:MAG: CDP-glucose 4,6-dehydratase [Cyanobacteriota bacterium]|nr:CDP-glucose 4,6-dehydratase [Cyanobacteriota bacterium]